MHNGQGMSKYTRFTFRTTNTFQLTLAFGGIH